MKLARPAHIEDKEKERRSLLLYYCPFEKKTFPAENKKPPKYRFG